MRSKHWTLGIVGLVVLALAVGCAPYRPYGSGTYPGGIYTTPPSGPGASGGPTFAPPEESVPPGTTQQFPSSPPGGSNGPSGRSPGGSLGDAPPFNPEKDGVTPPKDNFVPDYRDPGDARESSPQGSDGSAADDVPPFEQSRADDHSSFGSESSGSVKLRGIDSSAGRSTSDAPTGLAGETFVPPIKPASDSREHENAAASSSAGAGSGGQATEASGPNPYDYDRKGYSWLRGVVDYDPQTKTWNIIYDLRPSADDEFGGSITLYGSPELETLHDRDVVLVQGKIDRDVRDPFGKPRYRVEHLAGPLVPKR